MRMSGLIKGRFSFRKCTWTSFGFGFRAGVRELTPYQTQPWLGFSTCQPEIGKLEHIDDLDRVLVQLTLAHFDIAELTLDRLNDRTTLARQHGQVPLRVWIVSTNREPIPNCSCMKFAECRPIVLARFP